jgi:hypothetical protein
VKLVATVRHLADLEEAARTVAEAAGLALAEARMRLSREPPALLAALESSRAEALAASLSRHEIAAVAVDSHVPSDRDRTSARTIELSSEGVTFVPRSGERMHIAWTDVLAVLRGARESRRDTYATDQVQRPSGWASWVTDGFRVTTTEQKTFHFSNESVQNVILVYASDGRVAMVADDEFEFTSLGPAMQPSSTASLVGLAHTLRHRAPAAFYDERLVRLGCRPLPFLMDSESSSHSSVRTVVRTDTSEAFDVLAEVMRQALLAGLLP